MGEVAVTLHSSFTALLSVAVRLAEAGQDEEAKRLVDLAKVIRHAEETVRSHTKDARAGRMVKLNLNLH
jgi:urease accessory protein UreF